MEFAEWVCELSQRTNRSLAGARVYVPDGAQCDTVCAQGGTDLLLRLRAWGLVPTGEREGADFVWGELPEEADLSGALLMDRAAAHMPVSTGLARELGETGLLDGVRIGICLVLEPKTSVLVQLLHDVGAEVGVFAPAAEVDQRVADELRRRGFTVEADASWDATADHDGALRLLDELRPDLIIDDGASFARLAVLERPELAAALGGVAEETTSGVRAFVAMDEADALPWPVVAVNDSRLKTRFDNRHGTGETCVTTMQRLLGPTCFDGARVTVVGYGPVGEGFALRARALGAEVTVCDADPTRALEAAFAGFAARDLTDALADADIVVSATGIRHTLTVDHLRCMRKNATLAVIGGIANEIALDELPPLAPTRQDGIDLLTVPGGPTLRLLAGGDGVNYTAGGGNPIEVMDLSFAVQLSAVEHLLRHRGQLPHHVLRLGAEVDDCIARRALGVRGYATSTVSGDASPTVSDWKLTRFADEAQGGRHV